MSNGAMIYLDAEGRLLLLPVVCARSPLELLELVIDEPGQF